MSPFADTRSRNPYEVSIIPAGAVPSSLP
jgi:hypothetical protein